MTGGRVPDIRDRSAAHVVVVASALLVMAVGWWAKARCLGGGWADGEQFYGYCYSDVAPLWFQRGLDEGGGPYGAEPLEYPPVLAVRIWLAAVLAHVLPGEATVLVFTATNGLFVVVEVLMALALLRRLGLGPRRLLWWAAAPPLLLYAFYNWDTLPVVLLLAALLLHQRGHHTASGVLAGLGAAAKIFPGFLVPLVVLALLARRRPREALLHGGAAVLAFVAVHVPAYVLAPEGWNRFYENSSGRAMHVDSLWYLLAQLGGPEVGRDVLGVLSLASFGCGAAVVVVLGARRRPPEQWWQLLLPVLICFILANKVYSPQYTLWLVPLMALVLPRVAPFVAVMASDLLVHAVEFPFLAGRAGYGDGLPYPVMGVAVALRAAALVWVAVEVVRRPTGSPPGREPVPEVQGVAVQRDP
ncbi:glycosyltransferase family 87 protein [Blastococcus goldschmidtiae]|uniref:Glycosyltransferase 87 family protein n=1 Tax=Blastococcus goldschmidtiae TaxID=3075546 RepID=A0ABU2K2V9_9ACTN|nr:glycosyltransferase 87 family protein [Blastococcus sp. DSM 46792]MDT0274513.1 glycosyltransferase 87 family protein [Blastococcus sp. DSM 46792]